MSAGSICSQTVVCCNAYDVRLTSPHTEYNLLLTLTAAGSPLERKTVLVLTFDARASRIASGMLRLVTTDGMVKQGSCLMGERLMGRFATRCCARGWISVFGLV